jgi:hypothetical protein
MMTHDVVMQHHVVCWLLHASAASGFKGLVNQMLLCINRIVGEVNGGSVISEV